MKHGVWRVMVLVLVLAVALAVAGCAGGENTRQGNQANNDNELVQDEELTEKLKGEDAVADGQVYVQGNMAVGTMIVKEGISKDEVEELAQRYAQEIKKVYKDKTVNVQAVQGGENVANISLE